MLNGVWEWVSRVGHGICTNAEAMLFVYGIQQEMAVTGERSVGESQLGTCRDITEMMLCNHHHSYGTAYKLISINLN